MFSCLDHLAPPTNFLWSLDGNPLNDSDHVTIRPTGLLIITDVGPQDAGNYTCTVWGSNSSEASSSTAMLSVFVPVVDIGGWSYVGGEFRIGLSMFPSPPTLPPSLPSSPSLRSSSLYSPQDVYQDTLLISTTQQCVLYRLVSRKVVQVGTKGR